MIILIDKPFLSGFKFEALVVRNSTIVQIKNVPPIKIDTALHASSYPSPELPAAAIDANTSGAPFPKASRVTPANDSLQLNLSVMNSKHGDKYISAVLLKRYIITNIKKPPTIINAIFIPTSPNAW